MRKIVAGLFVSLDGVVESPEKWTGQYYGDDVGQVIGSLMAGGDTLLLGRVTYQTFAAAFGHSTSGDPMAGQMTNVAKVVVSTTLKQAEWQNTTLIGANVAEEIANLKRQSGKNINMSGSATLVDWLLHQRLLDELNLLLYPVVVGNGKRLFASGNNFVPLTLVESRQLSTGVVHLRYASPSG